MQGGNYRPRAWQGRGEMLQPTRKLVLKIGKHSHKRSFVAVPCRQDAGFEGLTVMIWGWETGGFSDPLGPQQVCFCYAALSLPVQQ